MITRFKADIIYKDKFQMEYMLYKLNELLTSLVLDDYKMTIKINDLKPYSNNIYKKEGGYTWVVNTLTKDARENIILPLFDACKNNVTIQFNNEIIKFNNMELVQTTYDSLISKHYLTRDKFDYITLNFKTPTSFKYLDQYMFYPDISLIYKSIIEKYNEFSSDYEIQDDEVLKAIIENTKVIDYNLRSNRFNLEKNKIPSFTGSLKLKIKGSETNKNLINLLLDFGQYSGIGIKTHLGMGGVEIKY